MKYNWKEMPTGNMVLEKEGFFISYQPNEVILAMPVASFKADGSGGETAVCIRDTEISNPYWILNGDFRKDFEKAETLKDCYDILKKNWSKISSWSNDLEEFPVQTKEEKDIDEKIEEILDRNVTKWYIPIGKSRQGVIEELSNLIQREAEKHEKEIVEAICNHLGIESLSIKRVNDEIISIKTQTKGDKE